MTSGVNIRFDLVVSVLYLIQIEYCPRQGKEWHQYAVSYHGTMLRLLLLMLSVLLLLFYYS